LTPDVTIKERRCCGGEGRQGQGKERKNNKNDERIVEKHKGISEQKKRRKGENRSPGEKQSEGGAGGGAGEKARCATQVLKKRPSNEKIEG